jgi:A/G-specific adenine glycosylase
VRGIILNELRAAEHPVPIGRTDQLWPDAGQLGRALAGLLQDGLAVPAGDEAYRLP